MQIATRKVNDVLVVELIGRLDSVAVGEVGDRLTAMAAGDMPRVVLNLAKMDYVSSSGLRVILRLSRLLTANGGELKLSSAQEMVGRVLETASFDSLLRLYGTETEALAAFGPG
jgi:anti-anti-sigma factor